MLAWALGLPVQGPEGQRSEHRFPAARLQLAVARKARDEAEQLAEAASAVAAAAAAEEAAGEAALAALADGAATEGV